MSWGTQPGKFMDPGLFCNTKTPLLTPPYNDDLSAFG